MRIGLFGGSFDPVHRGHVEVARAALRELALDRVLFLVTAQPPHKRDHRFAPALLRYAMVELALLDDDRLLASDLELTGQPVYTADTLARLRTERPGDELVLLLGADSLASFDTWRDWRRILATTELGVVARPGWEWREIEPGLAPDLVRAIEAARIGWVRDLAHPSSASEIRRRIATGEPVDAEWLDARVLRLIAKHNLYR